MGTMTLNDQKEQFSRSYVIGVAAVAGCEYSERSIDRDSVDIQFHTRKHGIVYHCPQLDAQLKATSRKVVTPTEIRFPLCRKNYDELKDDAVLIPRILVVTIVPPRPCRWILQHDRRTVLYRCSYWVSLRGAANVTNDATVTVSVPLAQQFTPVTLDNLMQGIADGVWP